MKQIGLYDEEKAMTKLSRLGDRLEWLNDVMDWRIFEESLDRVKPDKTQVGKGGRQVHRIYFSLIRKGFRREWKNRFVPSDTENI